MLVLLPLALLVLAAFAWGWRSTRPHRVPVSSVQSFHRALDAMSPDGDRRLPPVATRPRSRV